MDDDKSIYMQLNYMQRVANVNIKEEIKVLCMIIYGQLTQLRILTPIDNSQNV